MICALASARRSLKRGNGSKARFFSATKYGGSNNGSENANESETRGAESAAPCTLGAEPQWIVRCV